MSEVSIDINIAKGIVEALGQLQLDYPNSKARNMMVDHVVDKIQAEETEEEAA